MRSGRTLARGVGFNGATLLLLALFAVGTSLLFGVSWLRVMERIGAGVEALIARARRRREDALDRRIGDAHVAERELAIEHVREDTVNARTVCRRARGDRRRRDPSA